LKEIFNIKELLTLKIYLLFFATIFSSYSLNAMNPAPSPSTILRSIVNDPTSLAKIVPNLATLYQKAATATSTFAQNFQAQCTAHQEATIIGFAALVVTIGCCTRRHCTRARNVNINCDEDSDVDSTDCAEDDEDDDR
jgi:hypothetical protein